MRSDNKPNNRIFINGRNKINNTEIGNEMKTQQETLKDFLIVFCIKIKNTMIQLIPYLYLVLSPVACQQQMHYPQYWL